MKTNDDATETSAQAEDAPNTTPLNQDLNISNYMSSAQGLDYDQSGLEGAIGLTPLTVDGQIVKVLDETTGVYAEAFITSGDVPAGQRKIVIGYEGLDAYMYSKAFTGGQINDVGAIFAGKIPPGAETATAFARKVVAIARDQYGIGAANVSVTGQNLGGALAEYVASRTGLGGKTFAAPGIKLARGAASPKNFTNYINPGDPVASYTANGALGPLVTSSQIRHYGQSVLAGDLKAGQMTQQQLRATIKAAYDKHDYSSIAETLLPAVFSSTPLAGYDQTFNTVSSTQVNLVTLPPAVSGSPAGLSALLPIASGGLIPTVAAGQPSAAESSAPSVGSAPIVPNTTMMNRYLNLSNYMYQAKVLPFAKTTLGANLDVRPLRQDGAIVRVVNDEKGVTGEAFVTTGPGPKQIIVAFEGTAPYAVGSTPGFTGSQVYNDASLFAGQTPAGAEVAVQFALRVEGIAKNRFGDQNIVTLTGHSLGASEAEYAASVTGLSGATFGGTGIVTNAKGKGLLNFVNGADPVGNYAFDNGNAEGGFLIADDIQHYGGSQLIGDQTARSDLTTLASKLTGSNVAETLIELDFEHYGDYHHLYDSTDVMGPDGQPIHGYASSLNAAGYDVELIPLCFRNGTSIRTPRGDRAVETLLAGDVVVTASGAERPVRWVGHRVIAAPRHDQWPVRIAAHAFGQDLPERDLHLSPGHPVLVGADEDGEGGHLVPIMCLINGTTITREKVDEVDYWHVELDEHDILLAQGLPAESYVDGGDRAFFTEGADDALADPDLIFPGLADRCRPVAIEGPVVEAARRRLDAVFAGRLRDACIWPSAADAALMD